MGTDKADLPYEGTTLLRRQFETVRRALGGDEVRVSGNGRGLPAWLDDVPGGGPLSGIATALARIPFGRRLLVVPVDMPLLSVAVLERLVRSASGDEIVTRFRGHTMPFVLFNGPMVFALAQRMAKEQESVRRLCSFLSVREIEVRPDEERLFTNVNTMEEWGGLDGTAVVD